MPEPEHSLEESGETNGGAHASVKLKAPPPMTPKVEDVHDVPSQQTFTREEERKDSSKPSPLEIHSGSDEDGQSSSHAPPLSSSLAEEAWADFGEAVVEPGRKALHDFFYPPRIKSHTSSADGNSSMRRSASPVGSKSSAAMASASIPSTSRRTMSASRPPLPPPPRMSPPPLMSQNSKPKDVKNQKERVSSGSSAPIQQSPAHPSPSMPPQRSGSNTLSPQLPPPPTPTPEDLELLEQERLDQEYVEKFWTAYDEILILSLFTQIGILCRLGAAFGFRYFDSVFRQDSALFVNLPLNCLSVFVMGLLSSGESLMSIVTTRFTPPRLQHELHQQAQEEQQQLLQTSAMEELNYWDGLVENASPRTPAAALSTNQSFAPSAGSTTRTRRRRGKRARLGRHWKPQLSSDKAMHVELREVQLLALERRIRMSPCLLLFPVKKEDVDLLETYHDGFHGGQRRSSAANTPDSTQHGQGTPVSRSAVSSPRSLSFEDEFEDEPHVSDDDNDFDDMILEEEGPPADGNDGDNMPVLSPAAAAAAAVAAKEAQLAEAARSKKPENTALAVSPSTTAATIETKPPARQVKLKGDSTDARAPRPSLPRPLRRSSSPESVGHAHAHTHPNIRNLRYSQAPGGNVIDYGQNVHTDLDIIVTNVATDVTQKVSRMARVSLADGWDVGTSPEEKSEDLMLGLRAGLCGALSSFSSWISAMVQLFRDAQFGQAFVGLIIGVQLPIVAFRFGQHVAVYIFIWRCRRETRRDENRGGYGIRLRMDEDSDGEGSVESGDLRRETVDGHRTKGRRTIQDEEDDDETPSVRAIFTALFILALVAQITALNFFTDPATKLLALSLFFSPLGVISRWRLSKYNNWRPSFPIGTFTCNILACALSGSLGSLLAGNPDPEERLVLVGIISGFGGSLSSVAMFIVEILQGIDPVLFRLDGFYYAISSLFWGSIVSFVFGASADWVESLGAAAAVEETQAPSFAPSSSFIPSAAPTVTPGPSVSPSFFPTSFPTVTAAPSAFPSTSLWPTMLPSKTPASSF